MGPIGLLTGPSEYRRKYQLVCLPVNDADGSIEAGLRRNPKEAAWLDALLEGRIPSGY